MSTAQNTPSSTPPEELDFLDQSESDEVWDDEDEEDEEDEEFESDLKAVQAAAVPTQVTSSSPSANLPKEPAPTPIAAGMTPQAVSQRRSQAKIRSQRRRLLDRSLLALALEDQDPEFRNRIYELVIQTGIDVNDPAFLMMIATGRLEVLLEESPKELSALFDQWSEQVHAQVQEYRAGLEHYERAAVKGQQKAIAKAVSQLIQKTAVEQFVKSLNAMSIGLGAIVVLVAMGLGVGLGHAWAAAREAQTRYAPGQPWQLTLEEAQTLEWAMSQDGQFARNLMQWNQDLLVRDGKLKRCEQEADRLGVTLEVEGRKAKSGFCTLWVQPANQRQYQN